MKRHSIGKRICAMVLVLCMVLTMVPLDHSAAMGDIAVGETGLQAYNTETNTSHTDENDTIKWPVKIFDYDNDGMLFEYAETKYDGSTYAPTVIQSYGGNYYKPVTKPVVKYGLDWTEASAYNTNLHNNRLPAWWFTCGTPKEGFQHNDKVFKNGLRAIQFTGATTASKTELADFYLDPPGQYLAKDKVRYAVLVFRTWYFNANTTLQLWFGDSAYTQCTSQAVAVSKNADSVNASAWKYVVVDMAQGSNWNAISTVQRVGMRFPNLEAGDYIDITHIACFDNLGEAQAFGEQAVLYDRNYGVNTSLYTNFYNNLSFGLLRGSSFGETRRIGVDYFTPTDTTAVFNSNSKIYYLNTYNLTAPYDMRGIDFDGYKLYTSINTGVMTSGMLEPALSPSGTPVYREETVDYMASLLKQALEIPPYKDGLYNYNFVSGAASAKYGDTSGESIDLASALRRRIGINFALNDTTANMGSYADTMSKVNSGKILAGTWEQCKGNITTCYDAAYFLLNSLYIENSYNDPQNDYKYMVLNKAVTSEGKDTYIFDAGFVQADPIALTTADKVNSAVMYDVAEKTISLHDVRGKGLFYYSASYTTTLFPFLPIVAKNNGTHATKSPYFLDPGVTSTDLGGATYVNRNFNYALQVSGEFVYREEDDLFFDFEGDDDVYLFINGQLVLDIGGAHSITSVGFKMNDYVNAARAAIEAGDTSERYRALALEDGQSYSFEFFYMERHGYGANCRISSNIRVTDPNMRVEKQAYQNGEDITYGGVVEKEDAIEYNFYLENTGNTKLYNITFEDNNIGVKLDYTNGLTVADGVNGVYVFDSRGGTLDATDITAFVTGYAMTKDGVTYAKTYNRVNGVMVEATDGTGEYVYTETLLTFSGNEAIKSFLKSLKGEGLESGGEDAETTHSGAGLWVDAEVTMQGIFYKLKSSDIETGYFDNTVYVTASSKTNLDAENCEILRSQANHRVYIAGVPYYYQWADHRIFVSVQNMLDDATAASGSASSQLSQYGSFFNQVKNDLSKMKYECCDKYGRSMTYPEVYASNNVTYDDEAGTSQTTTAGFFINYTKTGRNAFYVLMYLDGADRNNLKDGEYAIVRITINTVDTKDKVYVLDYGLKTEDLNVNGALFKGDELFGSSSANIAKLMGVTTTEPSYLDAYTIYYMDYNRIRFNSLNLAMTNKVNVFGGGNETGGFFTFNLNIPDNGKEITYNVYTGDYSLTEAGTIPVYAHVPNTWDKVYLYFWYDGGVDNRWPGEEMVKVASGQYLLNIPGDVSHVIISNGTNQTGNLTITPGMSNTVKVGDLEEGMDYLPATVTNEVKKVTMHAEVPSDWGDVYLYYWFDDKEEPGWPGTKMTKGADGLYHLEELPGDITKVIINNSNGKQTLDLSVYAGKETWIKVNSTHSSTNEDGSTLLYKGVATCTTETFRIHASAPKDWEEVYLYYWSSNGTNYVDWPGLKMTKGEDGWYTLGGIPSDVTNVCINEGADVLVDGVLVDDKDQTQDLTVTAGLETWITVEKNEVAYKPSRVVFFQAPEGWESAGIHMWSSTNSATQTASPQQMTPIGNNKFMYVITEPGYDKVIFTKGAGIWDSQTGNLTLPADFSQSNLYSYDTDSWSFTDAKAVFFEAPTGWETAGIYMWNSQDTSVNTGNPQAMTQINDRTFMYLITEPAYDMVMFTEGAGSWNNQTANLTLPTNMFQKNMYTYNTGAWGLYGVVTTNANKLGATFAYGEGAEDAGITFTPTGFMDYVYNLWMAITVHEVGTTPAQLSNLDNSVAGAANKDIAVNINKEVQLYKKISILPANVVYYEDDYPAITYHASENKFDRIGSSQGKTQSVDQNEAYGHDSTYEGSDNSDKSGGSITKIVIDSTDKAASFTFKGTGFELISRTNASDSGKLVIRVYNNETNKLVKLLPVDTEFDNEGNGGNEAIYQVPVIRVKDMDLATYRVEISGVPARDYTQKDENGNYPIIPTIMYIDGIRIYQPLGNTNDAYHVNENGSTITEIRDLILKPNDAGNVKVGIVTYNDLDGLGLTAGTNTWTENRNGIEISDGTTTETYWGNQVISSDHYLKYGPNNEVYLEDGISQGALVFYVQEDASASHSLQIAVRRLDDLAFIGAGHSTAYPTLRYGILDGKGQYAWKELGTITSSTEQYYVIDYTRCPYVEGKGYQVVVAINSLEEGISCMASFTSLKYKGLTLADNATYGEATSLYYEEGSMYKVTATKDEAGNIIDIVVTPIAETEVPQLLSLRDQMKSTTVVVDLDEDELPLIGVPGGEPDEEDTSNSDKPNEDQPNQDEPGQDESSKDDSSADEPSQNEPGQDEPSQDEPSQDEPSKDGTSTDEPSQDEPSKDGTSTDEPSQDEPSKDEPGKDETSTDVPTQNTPVMDGATDNTPNNPILPVVIVVVAIVAAVSVVAVVITKKQKR